MQFILFLQSVYTVTYIDAGSALISENDGWDLRIPWWVLLATSVSSIPPWWLPGRTLSKTLARLSCSRKASANWKMQPLCYSIFWKKGLQKHRILLIRFTWILFLWNIFLRPIVQIAAHVINKDDIQPLFSIHRKLLRKKLLCWIG